MLYTKLWVFHGISSIQRHHEAGVGKDIQDDIQDGCQKQVQGVYLLICSTDSIYPSCKPYSCSEFICKASFVVQINVYK